MDTSDPDIKFDQEGVCNHCVEASKNLAKYRFADQDEVPNLQRMAEEIKSRSSGEYDCIIGLSGGVDSSFLAYLAVKTMGLNPLAVHLDNGWNSDISVSNINEIVNRLGIDLETYVIDWAEFKDLQRSFILAGVVDVELLTDHAIQASIQRIAKKYGITSSLSGGNYVTEHGLPDSWYWRNKLDKTNIVNIQRKFGTRRLKTFPLLSSVKRKIQNQFSRSMRTYQVLNSINYNKSRSLEVIQKELGWKDYGGKHRESVWTHFYQDVYLIERFGIDKRKVHLSALIRSNEVSREQALTQLAEPPLREKEKMELLTYVLKKLGFSMDDWSQIIRRSRVDHSVYGTENDLIESLSGLKAMLSRN